MPHSRAPEIVAAARACVGTRFRPQGRTPGLGLDCVGVVLIAAAAAGLGPFLVPAYAIGGRDEADVDAHLLAASCTEIPDAQPGDIIALRYPGGRRHLAVVTPGGAVHAHAGLGRVVEGPLDPAWPIGGAWRLAEIN